MTPDPGPRPTLGQTRVLVAPNSLPVGQDNGQTVAQVATLDNVDGRNYHVFSPAIATILVTFLILALSFGGDFGTARERLSGGSALAAALTAAVNLYIAHRLNPNTGFYMTT